MNLELGVSKRESRVLVGEKGDETSQGPKRNRGYLQMGSFQECCQQSCERGKPQAVQGVRSGAQESSPLGTKRQ